MDTRAKMFCFYLVFTCFFLIAVSVSKFSFAADLPNVVVVATGGTIAMLPDPKTGGYVPALSGEQLVEAVPEIKNIANVRVVNFSNLPSPDIIPEHWIRLSKMIDEILADPTVTGVVVPHGTATLPETAYFLDLTLKSDKPVVVVGAARNPGLRGTDGPMNLLNAVRVAIAKEAVGKGVTVTLNYKINAAREARKVHKLNVQTYTSGDIGYIGEVDPDRVVFHRQSLRRQRLPLPEKLPRVDIIKGNYAGVDPNYVKFAVDSGAQGIVIESFVPADIGSALAQEGVKYALGKGVAVALANNADGRAVSDYAYLGGGGTLRKMGCVFADNLPVVNARVLLMLALPLTKDQKQLQAYFDK